MSPDKNSVRIRPPTPGDRREFLERVQASRKLHHPWVSPPKDAAAFAAYVKRCESPDFCGQLVLGKDEDGEEAIVGVFNLSQIFLGPFRSAYLGYYAFSPFAGRGYMSLGLRLVLRYAFFKLGLHRVEANLQPENTASRALVQRCGFRQEGYSPRYLKIGGRWRDHERWALLSEDFRKRKKDS
jgi:ribosomal-protein-alanine N-acetyltransferase